MTRFTAQASRSGQGLLDLWEQEQDERSELLLTAVTCIRTEIKAGGRPLCPACNQPVASTEGVTYCVALEGGIARNGIICARCTAKDIDLFEAAAESLSIAQHGSAVHGVVGHA